MEKKTYRIEIAGLTRELTLCPLNENIDIAAFIMFSDVELTVACAEQLLGKCSDFDLMITAESKGIPLAYEMSRQSGKKYIVARKSEKLYMTDPLKVTVKSITTAAEQTLWLSREKADMLRGRKVLIVDDVISTGESVSALAKLVSEAGGIVSEKAAVLAEGDAAEREDITFLQKLPLFYK